MFLYFSTNQRPVSLVSRDAEATLTETTVHNALFRSTTYCLIHGAPASTLMVSFLSSAYTSLSEILLSCSFQAVRDVVSVLVVIAFQVVRAVTYFREYVVLLPYSRLVQLI
jgi:hypothetical protein